MPLLNPNLLLHKDLLGHPGLQLVGNAPRVVDQVSAEDGGTFPIQIVGLCSACSVADQNPERYNVPLLLILLRLGRVLNQVLMMRILLM